MSDETPNITTDFLTSKIWVYTHTYDRRGRVLKMAPDGTISGFFHPNERLWKLEDNKLRFLTETGGPSVSFEAVTDIDGKIAFIGEFALWSNKVIRAKLEIGKDLRAVTPTKLSALSRSDKLIAAAVTVPYRPVTYGDPSLDGTSYLAPAWRVAHLSDVTLNTEFGVIEQNATVPTHSLFHFPFHSDTQFIRFGEADFAIRGLTPSVSLETVLCGFGGAYDNHYHWLMFHICKLNAAFLNDAERRTGIIALPPCVNPVHRQSADVLAADIGLPIANMLDGGVIHVNSLIVPYQEASNGLEPHPLVKQSFTTLKQRLGGKTSRYGPMIYITRSDSNFRKLSNEAGVEFLLASLGFEIVRLSDLSLPQQIDTLAGARIVVGPHGAGLTNLAFCEPETMVLEFQSPGHINWCMKRIATLFDLQYGYLLGTAAADPADDSYTIDLGRLKAVLDDMGVS